MAFPVFPDFVIEGMPFEMEGSMDGIGYLVGIQYLECFPAFWLRFDALFGKQALILLVGIFREFVKSRHAFQRFIRSNLKQA
jgi:hypothetical protein